MKKQKCSGYKVAGLLAAIGAINWGLVGAFDFDLVNTLLGSIEWLERLVYIVVGISGVLLLLGCPCKTCKTACCKNEDCKSSKEK